MAGRSFRRARRIEGGRPRAGGPVKHKEDEVPTKKSVFDLQKMKRAGEKIAWLTAYDYPTATFEEVAGVDMILVGDSLGMCVYGYSGTVPVTMDQCIVHSEAVRRGAPGTFIVGDMRAAAFPGEAHCYHMFEGEHDRFSAYTKEDR
jgi:hypothetical protein